MCGQPETTSRGKFSFAGTGVLNDGRTRQHNTHRAIPGRVPPPPPLVQNHLVSGRLGHFQWQPKVLCSNSTVWIANAPFPMLDDLSPSHPPQSYNFSNFWPLILRWYETTQAANGKVSKQRNPLRTHWRASRTREKRLNCCHRCWLRWAATVSKTVQRHFSLGIFAARNGAFHVFFYSSLEIFKTRYLSVMHISPSSCVKKS